MAKVRLKRWGGMQMLYAGASGNPSTPTPVIDTDAQSYYDALNTANGGQVDYQTIYGISDSAALTALSTHFTNLKSAGVYSKLVHYYPLLGATAATHAVCAVDFIGELTYAGTPVHSATGVTLDGSTEYLNANNNPSVDVGLSDGHIQMLFDTVDTQYGFGSKDATSMSLVFIQTGGNKLADYTETSQRLTVADTNLDKVNIVTRVSNTDLQIYVDGASIGTQSSAQIGSLPTQNTWFGAWNNNGSPVAFGAGDVKSASIGLGLTTAQAAAFTTHIKSLQTAFGR